MTESPSRSQTSASEVRGIDMKLEAVVIPVSDVERAKSFYTKLGWRLDADFVVSDDFRAIQFTPPGSPCSVHFGKGITKAASGSASGLFLIVSDIEAARAELVARGVEAGEVFHQWVGEEPKSGVDPQRRSYASYATFSDPDGNSWLLQEIKTRLPGRGLSNLDAPTLTELLREAETRHGQYEPTAPKHHWSDWYAGYIVARGQGKTPEDAAKDGVLQVERARR